MATQSNVEVSHQEQALVSGIVVALSGPDRSFTKRQVDRFAELFDLLIEKIETRVLIELGEQLANHSDIPLPVMQHLARHNETRVAGPILARCNRITEQDLIEIASTRRDPHLLAISRREQVPERVVDLLIDRGSSAVRHSVVENKGAHISHNAFDSLSGFAMSDAELAFKVGVRDDVPPHVFCQLLVQAGRNVRDRLLSLSRPDMHDQILRAVDRVSGMLADEGSGSTKYAVLERRLKQRFSAINESQLNEIVRAGSRDEVQVALAMISGVSVEIIASLFSDQRIEPLLIIGRAFGYDWSLVSGLIRLYFPGLASSSSLQTARSEFDRIDPSTARGVINLWKMRETDQ